MDLLVGVCIFLTTNNHQLSTSLNHVARARAYDGFWICCHLLTANCHLKNVLVLVSASHEILKVFSSLALNMKSMEQHFDYMQKNLEEAFVRVCFSAFTLAFFVFIWIVSNFYVQSSLQLLITIAITVMNCAFLLVGVIWLTISLIDAHTTQRGLVLSLTHNASIFVPLVILLGYPILTLPRLENMPIVLFSFLGISILILVLVLALTKVLRDHFKGILEIVRAYLVFIFRGRNFWWTIIVWLGSLSVGLFLWSYSYPQEWRQFIFENKASPDAYRALLRFGITFLVAGQIAWVLLGYLKKKAIGCSNDLCLSSIAQCFIPLIFTFAFVFDFGLPPMSEGSQIASIFFAILSAIAGGLAAYKVAPRILRTSTVGEKLTLTMVLGIAAAIYISFISWIMIYKYNTFATGALTHGFYDQLVWNTAHGNFLSSSFNREFTTSLGEHASFIWLIIAPLYLIWSDPKVLFVAQSLLAALGAIPLYLISSHLFNSRWTGLVISGAYLLYFPLQNANLAGINDLALAPVFFLAAFYAWMKDRPGWMLLWLALLLGVNEELALTVAAFGLYSILFSRHKVLGFYIAVGGVAYFLLAIQIIIPHFRGAPYAFVLLPSYLGATAIDKLAAFALNPIFIIKSLIFPWPDKLLAFIQITGPLSFTPVFGGSALLMIIPAALIKWLSSDPGYWGSSLFSTAHLTPLLFVAACFGIRNVSEWRHSTLLHKRNLWISDKERVVFALAWVLLVGSFLTCYFLGATPISRTFRTPILSVTEKARMASFKSIGQMVPAQASLSAQDNVLSHFSERERISLFPEIRNASFIFLDLHGSKAPLNEIEYRNHILSLLDSGEYGLVAIRDGFALLRKDYTTIDNNQLLKQLK